MVTRQLWKGLSITAKRRPIFTLKSSRLYGLGVQGQGHGLADVNNFSELMRVNDVVSEAVKLQEPVVALESTIITHGMPYPENFR